LTPPKGAGGKTVQALPVTIIHRSGLNARVR
jgi:hypothetical protein